MKKLVGPLRRALIYGLISYGGLVLINNSELDLPNMWIAYLPMFIGVYVLTQWLDKKLGDSVPQDSTGPSAGRRISTWTPTLTEFIGALRTALEGVSRIQDHPLTYPN